MMEQDTKALTETAMDSPTADRTPVVFPFPITMNKCQICGEDIHTMAFMGTGVCSMLCKKKRDGDR